MSLVGAMSRNNILNQMDKINQMHKMEIKIKLIDKNEWPDEIINIMKKIEEIQNMQITV